MSPGVSGSKVWVDVPCLVLRFWVDFCEDLSAGVRGLLGRDFFRVGGGFDDVGVEAEDLVIEGSGKMVELEIVQMP